MITHGRFGEKWKSKLRNMYTDYTVHKTNQQENMEIFVQKISQRH
jgi:hypothetical protein